MLIASCCVVDARRVYPKPNLPRHNGNYTEERERKGQNDEKILNCSSHDVNRKVTSCRATGQGVVVTNGIIGDGHFEPVNLACKNLSRKQQ